MANKINYTTTRIYVENSSIEKQIAATKHDKRKIHNVKNYYNHSSIFLTSKTPITLVFFSYPKPQLHQISQ